MSRKMFKILFLLFENSMVFCPCGRGCRAPSAQGPLPLRGKVEL